MHEEKPFDEPKRIVLNRIYTKTGDRGETGLVGGQRVPSGAGDQTQGRHSLVQVNLPEVL